MSLHQFLARFVAILESRGIDYMISGSVASSVYGMPRSTQDIDLVLELDLASGRDLIKHLPDDAYYVSSEALADAIRRRSQFNVIDMETGWKVDAIIRKQRPFSEIEFSRRVRRDLMGVAVWMATPEDVLIAKLEWAKKSGGSTKQLNDAAGILRAQHEQLDEPYLQTWIASLSLQAEWAAALAASGIQPA